MKTIVSVILVIVGIVHLIPLKGVLGSDWILELYGISGLDRDLELLIRHRAVLFGLLGVFLILSAFIQQYQMIAIVAGVISTSSFIILSWLIGKPNELIGQVVMIDWVATALLFIAGVLLIGVTSLFDHQ